ncbi:hypothetical protein ASH00_15060 [Arthrobacter sp. Soil782]|uniref:hypothetical protein n=1 Tax=Arthrobacter sp. Soil782 TaxID=1736410 RepID=UPI0006FE4353|nr:hypothetical protein [Arthrobacter sp. Soil782]KRF03978.1 hypothetical protein ASH00_15060 [Arthrobacter sp. Soil782]
MAKQKLWAIAAAAGISAVLLTGCDDPGEGNSPEEVEETEFDDNNGIDDDLEDGADGDEAPSDVATEPSE